LNDCHNELEAAFKYAGFDYPGWPTGRSEPLYNVAKFVEGFGQAIGDAIQVVGDFFNSIFNGGSNVSSASSCGN
jgi:hypothetical protein